ncbi:MAG: hypothetical protein RI958_2940 [Actinomycetota bacterium]
MTRGDATGSGGDDPFAMFGLDRHASLDQVRSARRRLALVAHPDRGGDLAEMQRLNDAFERCIAHVTGRRPLPDPATDAGDGSAAAATGAPTSTGSEAHPRRRPTDDSGRRSRQRVERDTPSFTVDALPAETFEALLVVLSWIGELLDDDPPYLLECHLFEPAPCWCRLEVVPDAGASTVSLTVVSAADRPPVAAEVVRDVWVEHLNQLGRPMP